MVHDLEAFKVTSSFDNLAKCVHKRLNLNWQKYAWQDFARRKFELAGKCLAGK